MFFFLSSLSARPIFSCTILCRVCLLHPIKTFLNMSVVPLVAVWFFCRLLTVLLFKILISPPRRRLLIGIVTLRFNDTKDQSNRAPNRTSRRNDFATDPIPVSGCQGAGFVVSSSPPPSLSLLISSLMLFLFKYTKCNVYKTCGGALKRMCVEGD